MKDLLYKTNINFVCINCDSVIDNDLIHNNIHYLEYNKNTTNGIKIMNDLKKFPKIDMLIIDLTFLLQPSSMDPYPCNVL